MKTRRFGSSGGWVFLLLFTGCLHRASWPEVRGSLAPLSLSPCQAEGVQGTVLCGTLEVPEEWGSSEGRRITLRVMVLKATGAAPAADPVFILTGGPGQSAIDDAAEFATQSARTREQRDLVRVAARGGLPGGPRPHHLRGYFPGDARDVPGGCADPGLQGHLRRVAAGSAARGLLGARLPFRFPRCCCLEIRIPRRRRASARRSRGTFHGAGTSSGRE